MMKDRFLFGVCDGHGVNGHFVSDFIKGEFTNKPTNITAIIFRKITTK
jgi:serine/threonine protein phosphatase PrpC